MSTNAPYVIAIACFNREAALRRLLKTIADADYVSKPRIIFSVDYGGAEFSFLEDLDIEGFCYEVIRHKENLGLVGQFNYCGDLTESYDAVLFLEEDLVVSPVIDSYLRATIPLFRSEKLAACLNTTNMPIDEYTGTAIAPVDDGTDLFFTQTPYWGKVWLKESWCHFKAWLEANHHALPLHVDRLPKNIRNWPETSFKKTFIAYIVATNSYVPTPRRSYSSNMGICGLHAAEKPQYQAALCYSEPRHFSHPFASSLARYDVFGELLPSVVRGNLPKLEKIDFCVDLKGVRDRFSSEFVLTTRRSSRPLMIFEVESGETDKLNCRDVSGLDEEVGPGAVRVYLTSAKDLAVRRVDLWQWRSNYLHNKTDFNSKRLLFILLLRFLRLVR